MPEPGEGECLVWSVLLSLDPGQQLRVRPPVEFGRQYGRPIRLGDPVPGAFRLDPFFVGRTTGLRFRAGLVAGRDDGPRGQRTGGMRPGVPD